jgi:hypothetical protein
VAAAAHPIIDQPTTSRIDAAEAETDVAAARVDEVEIYEALERRALSSVVAPSFYDMWVTHVVREGKPQKPLLNTLPPT